MKSIMISIRPEWIVKILNGEKTIELRKSYPKCELPCKVYIYCTKSGDDYFCSNEVREFTYKGLCGYVIAEFVLNKITKHEKNFLDFEDDLCYNFTSEDVKNAGFVNSRMDDWEELNGLLDFNKFVDDYVCGKPLYAWHIDDLKIYDKPKELSEFGIKRAFQSWGYVEEIK